MTVTPERQALFARQAIQRYARGEAQFMPVLMDALGQYLALLRAELDAQPINTGPISRLVADAAPQPVPQPFTQRDADRIYTLMISDPNRWQPILDGVIMPAYSAMLGPITQAGLADPVVANAVQAWRSQWLADRRQILVHIPDAVTSQLRTKLDDLANATGTNVDDAQAEVQSMLDTGYPSWANRAELIARTETVAANNQGALASWSAMADAAGVTATKTWLSTPDGRTRPEHAAANGQTVAITGSFTVGGEQVSGPGDGSAANVCNCVLGDTRVEMPGLRAVTRRWYEGEIIRIETATGHKLAVTPNHPILSVSGAWVAASLFQKGDHLVCGTQAGQDMGAPNVDQRPAQIAEVERAARLVADPQRVRLSPPDFHGDGADGQVEVVPVDGHLLIDGEAATDEEVTHLGFALADLAASSESAGDRGPAAISGPPRVLMVAGAPGEIGGRGQGATLTTGRGAHALAHRLTAGTRAASALFETADDDRSADLEALGERLDRLPAVVTVEQIVKVERDLVAAHVYNLDSGDGWYIGNGIIQANCRCTMTFDIPADAPPAVQEQAQELETQLVAAGSGAPSQTIYFLDGFAVDAPADTAPVADDVQDAPTGVAVMAMLSAADAATLAQPGGEAPEDLHCTLGYLAKDAVEYSDDVKAGLVEALASAWTGPVPAKAFATAVFNASDPEREPCSVLLVQSDELAAAHQGISDAIGGLASTTFPVWIPHTALVYNAAKPLPPELAAGQTLTYDRLILAWGADHIDLTDQSLTAATEAPVTTPAPTAPPADVVAPGNDGSATGGDTPTALSPDLTPIGQTWSGPLAQLGIPSSDGRIIKAGGGTIRPLPLPLSWQRESGYGHEDSTITGRILAVEDRGDVLWGSGDYMDPMLNFDAQQAMAQVDAGLGMISVDIVPTAVGFADAEGNPIDPALYQGDPDGVNAVAVEWEFCGATLVSVQAFPLARIVNDPAPEVQPGAADMMIPGDFAGATPEGPVLADAGDSITLQDGSTVAVGDVVGLGDVDRDGDDDTGAITAINAEAATVDVQLLPDGDNDADDDPENPVTMTVPISSLVPPPATSTNKPGSDEAPPAGLAATSETFAEGEPMPDTVDEDFALLASSYTQPYRAEFFRKQTLDGPTAIQLDRETGQIFGHLGAFGVCHVAKLAETGMCVTVPEGDDFSMFHLGEVVTEDGPIQVGKITVGGGHYGAGGVRGAIEHYDRTSSIAAPVRAYYDDYGIQVCGQLLHGIDPHKVDELMAAGQLSGDWRGRSPNRKLVAALAVNQGSFPVERISPIVGLDANGEQTSLVAAGIVYPPEPDNDITLPSGAKVARSDFETLVASMMETIDRSKVAAAPVTDELKLRRAKARLRLHSLASGE
jgi:hypothetical protein